MEALAFGVELPKGKVSLPAPPTWIAYAGDHQHCMENVPVALSTENFCNAFLGEARVFKYYNAWVLAMLLEHSNKAMVTYPEIYFKATEFSASGEHGFVFDSLVSFGMSASSARLTTLLTATTDFARPLN